MVSDLCREAFERDADEHSHTLEKFNGVYTDQQTQQRWWGFQAGAAWQQSRTPDPLMEEMRTALKVVIKVMEIAWDWDAPMAYDIEAPEGWEETIDSDGDEPTWPTLYGIINKCKTLLAKLPAAGEL